MRTSSITDYNLENLYETLMLASKHTDMLSGEGRVALATLTEEVAEFYVERGLRVERDRQLRLHKARLASS
jgi:hypothetical protein